MVANKPTLELALGLIERERYTEARTLLERVRDNVTAQKWLAWLDERAPVSAWEQTGSQTIPTSTQEFELALLAAKPQFSLGANVSRDLAHVNQTIEDTEADYRYNRLAFVTGVLTLPLFGTGAAIIGYAAYKAREKKNRLTTLLQQRGVLLKTLENSMGGYYNEEPTAIPRR